jgi:hypothetical protein
LKKLSDFKIIQEKRTVDVQQKYLICTTAIAPVKGKIDLRYGKH